MFDLNQRIGCKEGPPPLMIRYYLLIDRGIGRILKWGGGASFKVQFKNRRIVHCCYISITFDRKIQTSPKRGTTPPTPSTYVPDK